MQSAQPYKSLSTIYRFTRELVCLLPQLSPSSRQLFTSEEKSQKPYIRSREIEYFSNLLIDRDIGAVRIGWTMIRRRFVPRVPCLLFFSCTILLSYNPVLISAAVVTLNSIEIFKTHEWIPAKPTVFFQCKGENEIVLPDVKEKHVQYTFKGEESWQPLTEVKDIKCKRCGFYEKDAIKSDDVFDEWEFCASDFSSDGKYTHFKDKEFNATFLCLDCVDLIKASHNSSSIPKEHTNKMMHWSLIIVISCVASALFISGLVAGCKYWQKRKRQQQQARFLQLFEDADDIEDELGIGPLSHTI